MQDSLTHQAAKTKRGCGSRSTRCSSQRLLMPRHARGMALESVGAASCYRLVMVTSSLHKTSVLVRLCMRPW